MANPVASFLRSGWQSIKEELQNTVNGIRSTRLNLAFLFAVFCVFFVIVGNIILLIAINFWIAQFPTDALAHNSSQIAIQVVSMSFLVFIFSLLCAVFTAFYGALPLWHVLTDRNRVGGPLYRLFLLFASGASNGLSSVVAVYAITYTPEFIQAVLLCCIPFSAQAWTVIFIPIERKRNYLSMLFIASFVLFVAGVLLTSMSAFLHPNAKGETASWAWALLYLVSCVLFGIWCVVQRLYLDAVMLKAPPVEPEAVGEAAARDAAEGRGCHAEQREDADAGVTVHTTNGSGGGGGRGAQREELRGAEVGEELDDCEPVAKGATEGELAQGSPTVAAEEPPTVKAAGTAHGGEEDPRFSDLEEDEELPLSPSAELLVKRQWGSQNVDDNAAKVVLLVVGLLFQLLVSFVVFPVDAIPWFGTSNSVLHAWQGFCSSMDFIFSSWLHVRHGVLMSLGFAMSFVGCTYLNEHSPTLASVVLQLAGPITSLIIIIVPQWNVYQDNSNVGQKVGGVILLLVAALLYHLWEQQSLRVLQAKAEEAKRRRERAAAGHDTAGAQNSAAHEPTVETKSRELKMMEKE